MGFLDAASSLLLAAALGATLLLLALSAAVGGIRTLCIIRGVGVAGALLAVFVGIMVESLAASLVDSPPYSLAFLQTTDLRVEALAQDPDLRTRYNADPRLRYLPRIGTITDLETVYDHRSGIRSVWVPPVFHETPVPKLPSFVTSDATSYGQEVDGLYDRAFSTVETAGRGADIAARMRRADLLGAASVGFLLLASSGCWRASSRSSVARSAFPET